MYCPPIIQLQLEQMQESYPIKFTKQGPFSFLSNFHPAPFTVPPSSTIYKTNEHYFQSHKLTDKSQNQRIIATESPKQAMEMGRSREFPLRSDWEEVKQQVMLEGLINKFRGNEELSKKLMQTGDRLIIQEHATDRYWGNGSDGTGKNRLGVLIMKVRELIREQIKE